ncbi:TIGR02588 family protein [Iodidimonas sp. SYSU 1G8]|uniref:TIGR02588 family protein n=1 Tax=Iodidimonas sp. SYSU 1G8 TaxID=3133967 RepID=UPI0031FF0DCE
MAKPDKSSTANEARRIPRSEWAVALLGLTMVIGVIAYLVTIALTDKDTPPDITLKAVDIRPTSGGYLVRVEALNHGGQAAADVKIDATLKRGEDVIERREISFDFLPTRSKRVGGVIFSQDPATHGLELQVLSHREP